MDYLWIIVMFLSAVWTLILTAPIHCRASIAETLMQRHISPNLMKKQTHLHLVCTKGSYIFIQLKFLPELFFKSYLTRCVFSECSVEHVSTVSRDQTLKVNMKSQKASVPISSE